MENLKKLEESSAKKTKRNNIKKAVLLTVKTAGLLSMALLAPNAIQVLKSFGYKPGKNQNGVIRGSRNKLITNGLLKYEGRFLKLTPKGEKILRRLEINDYKIARPKRWDKKWRIITFDIKEDRRKLRDKVRRILMSIGFINLQKSVWIYPYKCEDLISMLKAEFEIGKDVLYIIADEVENDRWLKEYFELEEFSKKPETKDEKVMKAISNFLFQENEGKSKRS